MAYTRKKQTRVKAKTPGTLTLTVEERISILANLIVDKIEQDAKDGYPLLDRLKKEIQDV